MSDNNAAASNTDATDASTSLVAWKQLLAKLAEAGETICSPTGARTPQERAEGFRYLTRLVGAGLDMHLEQADPARPFFTDMLTPTRKFLGDNPDTRYDYVPLDGSHTYRVWGNRDDSVYLALCVYGKKPDGNPNIGGNLSDVDMHFESDGSFEVFLSAEKPKGAKNWLQLNSETTSMVVRKYFMEPAKTKIANVQIETLDETPALDPYTEEELAQRLGTVGNFVADTSSMAAALSVFAALNSVTGDATEEYVALQVVDGEMKAGETKSAQELAASIDPKIIAAHLPTPDIQYAGAWWKIRHGEAVVVEGKPPKARYWSIQIFNRWLESPDYRHLPVSLNHGQVELEPDGSFRILISNENPGVSNWIDASGYQEGQVCCRALIAEEPLEVKFRVAKLSELFPAS
jgi:hypothetical protein